MSKQKKYCFGIFSFQQAHLIQQQINKLYDHELKNWNNARDDKIEQSVLNLRTKHQKERDLFNKKVQIQL